MEFCPACRAARYCWPRSRQSVIFGGFCIFQGGLEALTEAKAVGRVGDMSIKVDLAPHAESGLLAQAQARGLSLEAYATQLLESYGSMKSANKLTPPERLNAFDEFVRNMESNVVLSEEAFHRENWYPDRG